MQPEAKLVRKLQSLFQEAGACCFKIHGGDNPFQAVGIPDLLMCHIGRFVGVEVKMPGEHLRPAQVVALNEIYRSGGVAAVIETVEQGRKLLLTIERMDNSEEAILFDRGRVRYVWGKGPG